jgi:O-acetyl-ADP-ribose deacetylase (regulator of RNase III)
MIYEVAGDILLSKAQALVHGIAPGDPFDSGLALALRERWPAMLKDFRHYSHSHHPHPGQAWVWGSSTGQRIINLLTQEAAPGEKGRPGRARLESVNHALRELRRIIQEEKLTSVALPKLATGVGGLAWEDVLELIKTHLGGLEVPVILYSTYHPNQQAVEPLTPQGFAQNVRREAR